MIGGATYDPNFNTSRTHTYNFMDVTASSNLITAFQLATTNPSNNWDLYPGATCPGYSSNTLPSSITSWQTANGQWAYWNFVFVGVSSGGFAEFNVSRGDLDAIPGVFMQEWYDYANTNQYLPTTIDAQPTEQSNTIYSNIYMTSTANPGGYSNVPTQEVNCIYTINKPPQPDFCA